MEVLKMVDTLLGYLQLALMFIVLVGVLDFVTMVFVEHYLDRKKQKAVREVEESFRETMISGMEMLSAGLKLVAEKNKNINAKVDNIVESQRLSTILNIESKNLGINVEDFKPKKEVIMAALFAEWEDHKHSGNDSETKAYCILYHSGFAYFLEKGKPRLDIQDALTKLIINKDDEKVKNFLEMLINQL